MKRGRAGIRVAFSRFSLYVGIGVAILIILGLIFAIGQLAEQPAESPSPSSVFPPSLVLPYISKDEIVRVPQMWNPPGHVGVDFEGRMDTRFCAVDNGEIAKVEKYLMSGYGTWAVTVTLEINPVYSAIYVFEPDTTEESVANLQLQKLVVEVGDRVTAGQLIGYLYAHGSYPHIHFVVSENDVWVDPFPYFTENAQEEIMELYENAYS